MYLASEVVLTRCLSWHIITSELRRLWQFYIGLPVTPRSWGFMVPRVDEL